LLPRRPAAISVSLSVQGEFLDDSLSNVDVKDQLVQLTKKAAPRV
jgi:hypothetical protein